MGHLGEFMNENTKLTLRLPGTIRAWLQAKADVEERSVNAQIIHALKAAMKSDPMRGSTNDHDPVTRTPAQRSCGRVPIDGREGSGCQTRPKRQDVKAACALWQVTLHQYWYGKA